MPQWTGLAAKRFADARVDGTIGNDSITGTAQDDVLFGDAGANNLYGGASGDFVYGGTGSDVLFGDAGYDTAKGTDLSVDRLDGGGQDRLVQSDGNDIMTGGRGADDFLFRYNDPLTGLAAGTGPAFTTLTDFKAGEDQLLFDAAGVGKDRSADVNFLDGGAGDGTPGGRAATFFSGGDAPPPEGSGQGAAGRARAQGRGAQAMLPSHRPAPALIALGEAQARAATWLACGRGERRGSLGP